MFFEKQKFTEKESAVAKTLVIISSSLNDILHTRRTIFILNLQFSFAEICFVFTDIKILATLLNANSFYTQLDLMSI